MLTRRHGLLSSCLMSTRAPTVALRHGAAMPRLGLGTSPMDDQSAETSVAFALECGFRLDDTAENYGTERGVRRGLRASTIPREDVFVTTKFNKQWHGVDLVAEAYQHRSEEHTSELQSHSFISY